VATPPAFLARASVGGGHAEAPLPQPRLESQIVPGANRPRLRVMRSEAPTAGAPTAGATVPAPAPDAAQGPARARAEVLARATAGAIEYEDDGRVSVLFPPPGSVFASPGGVIARAESTPAAAAAEIAPPAPAEIPALTAAPAAAVPLDRDELYADFMRRLRRDVLEQREQLGDL
jgi:hypothetical protein